MTDETQGARIGAIVGAELSDGLRAGLADGAEEALEPLTREAERLREVFTDVGRTLSGELERAARDGELSFKRLGVSIAADLAKAFGSLLGEGLKSLVSAPIGARADGGPVAPGVGYLVGERGPEVFYPNGAGRVGPGVGGGVQVVVNVHGAQDPSAFRRSEAQIGAALARAVNRAQRQL